MKIAIGKAGNKNIDIDLSKLLVTRLLIQADSGGGKTYLLRLLCEQLWGKVQVIIVDPEGEFATLREKFGYVLVGKDGDTPADSRSAELLAHRLLELKASAICDIYEMKPKARHEWVRIFLDALIEAPKNLRHPVLLIVDEAHIFCPEKGSGESEASEAMIALCTRGRKRGLCAVFATQRLQNLSKSASGMLLNRLIGPTFESGNINRAADELGIPKARADRQEFIDKVKMLDPGNFYGLGRAISRELVLVKVNKVQTTHPEVGTAYVEPPPPPKNIAKMLPKLSDLPKQAEQKARTEAEFKAEIRRLTAELNAAKRATPVVKAEKPQTVRMTVGESTIKAALSQEIEPWRKFSQQIRRELVDVTKLLHKVQGFVSENVAGYLNHRTLHPLPDYPVVKVDTKALKATLESVREVDEYVGKVPAIPVPVHARVARQVPPVPQNGAGGDLKGPQMRILVALAELLSIGQDKPSREMLAGWASYSPTSSAYTNPLGALRTEGYVTYPTAGTVVITSKGTAVVGHREAPDQEELRRRVDSVCKGPERKILNALLQHRQGTKLDRETLAAQSGYSPTSSAFTNPLGALRTKGFVEYPDVGFVKASDWLFVQ